MSPVTIAVLLGFVCCALVIRVFALRGTDARPVPVAARSARSGGSAPSVDA
ncbi:hypothetical protein [Nocardia bhagyanarayanae]|uniref:Uncharacterized protein n=1 Tax=Nocardia bhagyanarayanae TaxID=1215925 RepID=A0A543FCB3_9NOCA|nr:hypothetical protein [Nocardia bhagyanarayanae]TQM31384.1 hypothetical protein FB390_3041 [Nocardia bhagyanarayanae]